MSGNTVFKVEDMTCMHCVGSVRAALAEAIPGAAVEVDLDRKRVTVPAAQAEAAAAAMRDAGFEPEPLAA